MTAKSKPAQRISYDNFALFHWLKHRSLRGPAKPDSSPNSCEFYPSDVRPVVNRPFLSVNREFSCSSLIPRLLFRGRPSAVCRFVISIVINSVNAHCGTGWVPHVLKKVFKDMPARTYRYSSCAVFMKSFVVAIFATLANSAPAVMHFGMAEFMTRRFFARKFVFKASTRSAIAGNKVVCSNNAYRSALALTFPFSLSVFRAVKLKDCVSRKFLSSEVECFHGMEDMAVI